MKVPIVGGAGSDGPGEGILSRVLAVAPLVNELLCEPWWDDVTQKGERALFTFWDLAGTVRLIIKVASPPLKLSVLASTYDDAIAALELCLEGEDPPWQQDDRPLKAPPKSAKKKA